MKLDQFQVVHTSPSTAGQHEHQFSTIPARPMIVEVKDLRKLFPKRQAKTDGAWWQRFRRGATEQFVAVQDVSFTIQHRHPFGRLCQPGILGHGLRA